MTITRTARRRRGWRSAARTILFLAATLVASAVSAATYSVPRFSDTAVVQGLSGVTDFAFTPDGRMLVLEKAGKVRIVVNGALLGTAALDITANVDDGNEKGLLGVCLHPGFATNGYIFLYYTTNTPRNRISRFTLSGNTINPLTEAVILDNIEATNGNHNGGTVLIGPDGKLWAAPGDSGTGWSTDPAKAQDLRATSLSRFNGKVLRMELDGSPAAGNPFLADPTVEPRIWAYGFRNPFRFSFRPSNGSIYIGDVGQSTREELDVGVAGGNFGWPYMEGFIQQPGGPGPCPATTTCLPPVLDYPRTDGTTITGGAFVTGNAYPASLQGRYVFADYGSNWIKYLELDANDAVVGGLQNLATGAEGPVAFHQGPDGYLYYAAIKSGKIYRVNYGKNFHTVSPCRVFDTRGPAGPWGGPRLAAGADRTFVVGGLCGVPVTARAVSVNITVTEPSDFGFLTLYPAGGALSNSSTINFRPGQTRANNAVVTLGGPAASLVIRAGMASGGVHVILDVSGYFDE